MSGEICEFSINVNVINRKFGNWIRVNGAKTKSSANFTGNFPSNLVSSFSIWCHDLFIVKPSHLEIEMVLLLLNGASVKFTNHNYKVILSDWGY